MVAVALGRFAVVLALLVVVVPSGNAAAACYSAQSSHLQPPALVLAELGSLHEIDSSAGLPAGLLAQTFGLRGGIAGPGGRFNSTDAITPGLPPRGLIFAACDARLCVLHYEWGGLASSYDVLALARDGALRIVWHAEGNRPLRNLADLRTLIAGRSTLRYFNVTDRSCY